MEWNRKEERKERGRRRRRKDRSLKRETDGSSTGYSINTAKILLLLLLLVGGERFTIGNH